MKKLFHTILLLIIPIVLSAEIDERKTDVYFSNGILLLMIEILKYKSKLTMRV